MSAPNPAFPSDSTQSQSLISNLRKRGYEFEIMGGLTEHLSVVAGATFLHERDSLGQPVRAIADRNATLFLNLDFSLGAHDGLAVFTGVVHTGRLSGEAPAVNFTPLGVVTQPSFFLGRSHC